MLSCVTGGGEDAILKMTRNVTAVLGEVVYLSCIYLGESKIQSSEWKRQITSKVKSKGLAGFTDRGPFSNHEFSDPDSLTNLTVQMRVSSVKVEGEYTCEFELEEGYLSDSVFVTVVGKPKVVTATPPVFILINLVEIFRL